MLTPSLLTLELARLHQAELLSEATRRHAIGERGPMRIHLPALPIGPIVERLTAALSDRRRSATTVACATC